MECLQRRQSSCEKACSQNKAGSRPSLLMGKADDTEEVAGVSTLWTRRGMGPGIRGRIRRDIVGKIPWAAAAVATCQDSSNEVYAVVEESPRGLARESIRAMTEG